MCCNGDSGVSCLNSSPIPLDLASFIWKHITADPLTSSDLRSIDLTLYNTIETLRNPHAKGITDNESFIAAFGDSLTFTTFNASIGREIELIPNGRNVSVNMSNA